MKKNLLSIIFFCHGFPRFLKALVFWKAIMKQFLYFIFLVAVFSTQVLPTKKVKISITKEKLLGNFQNFDVLFMLRWRIQCYKINKILFFHNSTLISGISTIRHTAGSIYGLNWTERTDEQFLLFFVNSRWNFESAISGTCSAPFADLCVMGRVATLLMFYSRSRPFPPTYPRSLKRANFIRTARPLHYSVCSLI